MTPKTKFLLVWTPLGIVCLGFSFVVAFSAGAFIMLIEVEDVYNPGTTREVAGFITGIIVFCGLVYTFVEAMRDQYKRKVKGQERGM